MGLSITGLRVDIAGRTIVKGVSLEVPRGRFAGLLGPNGSGKSTLLKAIYRALRPVAGTVRIDGADLLAMKPKEAAQRLAVVAQESLLEFGFTVRELVAAGRNPHKGLLERDTDEDRHLVDIALHRVGCVHLQSHDFNTLSGGEKQRVLIARALAQGAQYLLLDEPTNHLDIRYQMQVLELVADLDLTVLAALHDLSLAALFCDQVHLLASGEIVANGPPSDVITAERVQSVYGADVLVVPHPEAQRPHLIPRRKPARHA